MKDNHCCIVNEIIIKKIKCISELEVSDIKDRAENSSKTEHTIHYVVEHHGSEIGFISLDIIPGVDYLVLYELFVTSSKRRKGYGAKILNELGRTGEKLGYKKLTVYPQPLDNYIPKSKLIDFYKKNGFKERPDRNQELEKIL